MYSQKSPAPKTISAGQIGAHGRGGKLARHQTTQPDRSPGCSLAQTLRRGESYSDVIIRLAKASP